ncbi:hypothetical protein [Cohnella cholangitidis]|uniref:Lipoprotein n=1 Tax=Cohnella cholangitidis TaxID=2598458 RepID=A0A7G5BSV2_9BACL|nr:hypothetical protein [Cohnella cholangitidis]QMV40036.1 hypothetical protein FPL14_01590 [Cohnella cholangitidis]
MKTKPKKRLLLFLFTLILVIIVGCNNASPTIKEVKLQELNNGAKIFVDTIKNNNGVYLYSREDDKQYLIVNYSNVLQGEEALFLDSINAQVMDRTLKIHIEELGTTDYQDKRLNNIRVFNLSSTQEYEKIKIYKNGKETRFDSVGG